jgi:hypothetical protein
LCATSKAKSQKPKHQSTNHCHCWGAHDCVYWYCFACTIEEESKVLRGIV